MMQEELNNITRNTANLSIWDLILEPFAWLFPRAACFLSTCFSETSRDTSKRYLGCQNEAKGYKRSQNKFQEGIGMMPNDFPIYNQSTQVVSTVLINPRKVNISRV